MESTNNPLLNLVELHTGEKALNIDIQSLWMSLQKLDPVTAWELKELCKNPEHKIYSEIQKNELLKYSLINANNKIHDNHKPIIRACLVGDDLHSFKLVNPISGGSK